jgi:hypothetical protein
MNNLLNNFNQLKMSDNNQTEIFVQGNPVNNIINNDNNNNESDSNHTKKYNDLNNNNLFQDFSNNTTNNDEEDDEDYEEEPSNETSPARITPAPSGRPAPNSGTPAPNSGTPQNVNKKRKRSSTRKGRWSKNKQLTYNIIQHIKKLQIENKDNEYIHGSLQSFFKNLSLESIMNLKIELVKIKTDASIEENSNGKEAYINANDVLRDYLEQLQVENNNIDIDDEILVINNSILKLQQQLDLEENKLLAVEYLKDIKHSDEVPIKLFKAILNIEEGKRD